MTPQIEGQTLTETDIGRHVIYVPNHAPRDPKQWEHGILSSFREDGAIWVRFKGPTGERCDPHQLRWGTIKATADNKTDRHGLFRWRRD